MVTGIGYLSCGECRSGEPGWGWQSASHELTVRAQASTGSLHRQRRSVARGFPVLQQLVIHPGNEHLEAGHFLESKPLAALGHGKGDALSVQELLAAA